MNITQVFEKVPTQKDCIAHLEKTRWGDKPICLYCKSDNTARMQHRHRCYNCRTAFSVTVGTIFHHTHVPLQKWCLAVTLMLNAKKGLSALQLSRDLQVNKNTAWRIAMQIRKAMNQVDQQRMLSGIVEMEETYVGGKPRKGKKYDNPEDKPKPDRSTKKAPVIGALERMGNVTAKAVPKSKMKGRNLRAFVTRRVDTKKTRLITDEYKGYRGTSKLLKHDTSKHKEWYVEGDVHTNNIESFWAVLKRGMFGQFHSVSGRHLQKYVDEFCFRYNMRHVLRAPAWTMFDKTLNRALGVTI